MGIVYVASNPALLGMVKVGVTMDLSKRIGTLWTTNIPVPFGCIFGYEVNNAYGIERELHEAFSCDRVHSSREFFYTKPADIIRWLLDIEGEPVPLSLLKTNSPEYKGYTLTACRDAIAKELSDDARAEQSRLIRTGMEYAKSQGRRPGRKAKLTDDDIMVARQLRDQGWGLRRIAEQLKVSRTTVHNALGRGD